MVGAEKRRDLEFWFLDNYESAFLPGMARVVKGPERGNTDHTVRLRVQVALHLIAIKRHDLCVISIDTI